MLNESFEKLDQIIKARRDLASLGNLISTNYMCCKNINIKIFLQDRVERMHVQEDYFVSNQFRDFPQAKAHILPFIAALAKRANKRFNDKDFYENK